MRYLKYLLLLAVLVLPAAYSQAQVAIGVRIGPSYGVYNAPPVCPYGFYPDYPFGCAPYGYWGPDWFVDGVFIGAGPWYNFYYTHPGFYRPYYFNRGFGFRGHEHFRDNDRFRDRGFRDNDRFRDRGFRSFNGGDRGFRDGRRAFRDNDGRAFHSDNRGGFRGNAGRNFHDGGGRAYRGGEARGGGSSRGGGDRGGRGHGGRR
ncbi:MAG TPA: hypothetical protein VEW69_04590 [Alphaproteobacteria bacterium]|nr:hypothetical protein [Alphaproteobacteria bacterium]